MLIAALTARPRPEYSARSPTPAQVAELVDAPASGAGFRMEVEVRVLSWAPLVWLGLKLGLLAWVQPENL